jgi:hypothetical protein
MRGGLRYGGKCAASGRDDEFMGILQNDRALVGRISKR